MKTQLLETKDKVYIGHIPSLKWGKGHDISFVKSTQLALTALGEDYSYDFLMGISGAAFRFHFHPDWCPSAGDVTTGFDVSKVLFESLGYNCKLCKIDDNSFDDISALYKDIITQINKGIPIIAINLKECPEWGLVTGYLKNSPGILCRTYFDDDEDYSLAEHAPWLSFFIGEKGKAMERKALFRNSIKIAVQLARTDHFDKYYSGLSAFHQWIWALDKKRQGIESGGFKEYEVNLTLLYYLLDSRKAAARYLASMRDLMNDGDALIDLINQEVELLHNALKSVLPSFDSKAKDWTSGIIREQIDVLWRVAEIEKETCDFIEKDTLSGS